MAMIPIPSTTLLAAMARIRAGENLTVVAPSLHIDPERLSRQLRTTFADFEGLMAAHSRHKAPRLGIESPRPRQPKCRKRVVKRTHVSRVDFATKCDEPERAQAFADARARGMRIMAEFNAEEIEALRIKVEGWLARGDGKPVYTPRGWMEHA